MTYSNTLNQLKSRYPSGVKAGITIEDLAQLKTQNTYKTHLDISKSMARVMRADMARYDNDTSQFTQSLGCWSGFHAMQMMRAIKRQKGTLDGAYVYLSGWMVAGLRNRFGHLPDQSMHEKTAVVDLIEEIYVRELSSFKKLMSMKAMCAQSSPILMQALVMSMRLTSSQRK